MFECQDLCESYLYLAGLPLGSTTSFFATSQTLFGTSGENQYHFLNDSHFPFSRLGKRKTLRKAVPSERYMGHPAYPHKAQGLL